MTLNFGDMSFSQGASSGSSYTNYGSSSTSGGTNWGGIINAGGQVLGGIFDYNQNRDSASDLSNAYNQISQDARQDAGIASNMADPYQQYRAGNANYLARLMSGDADFRTDPGYQFRLGEATRETERAAASRGFNRSGNVMAAIDQRSQDVASQEYNNIINRLIGLSGATPQNAIAGGQTYGNMMGTVYGAQLGAAANRSQASSGSGLGGLIGTAGSAIGGLF